MLLNDYAPFNCLSKDFVISRGSKVVVVDSKFTTFVHFRVKLNYFHVLHYEFSEMLKSFGSSNGIDLDRVLKLEHGVKLLVTAIKRIKNSWILHNPLTFQLINDFRDVS